MLVQNIFLVKTTISNRKNKISMKTSCDFLDFHYNSIE